MFIYNLNKQTYVKNVALEYKAIKIQVVEALMTNSGDVIGIYAKNLNSPLLFY